MTKPPIWKRLLRWTAFALLAVVTLLALAISWISYQGRVDWAHTKAELLAKGEKLTLVELAPPPVPDKDNFFADPIWKTESEPKLDIHSFQRPPLSPIRRADTPLTSSEAATFRKLFPNDGGLMALDHPETCYRAELCYTLAAVPRNPGFLISGGDRVRATFLLDVLTPLHPAMDRIRELLDRPAARWPYDFSEHFFTQTLDPYPGIMSVAKAFSAEGSIYLALGEASKAAEDVRITLNLGERLKDDPLLYAQMARAGVLATAFEVLEQGLSAHAWSDVNLQQFEDAIARIDLISGGALAFRGARGQVNQLLEALEKKPSLWEPVGHWSGYYDVPGKLKWKAALAILLLRIQITLFGAGDQATLSRLIQQVVEAFDSAATTDFRFPEEARKSRSGLDFITHFRTEQFRFILGNASILARQQTDFRQALIVCALERYQLKYKCYPETLEALVPGFISKLPKDVYTAKSFQYRLESPDRFRLWSVGPMPGDSDDDIVWNRRS